MSTSPNADLYGLLPADRFMPAVKAQGHLWKWSRPDQAYGTCPLCGGNASLGVDEDGSCGFTCFRGCRTADVLVALELPRGALFVRGTRGPTVDLSARERSHLADQRAQDLQGNARLLDLLASLENIAPWALSDLGVGLLADRGLSIPERNHRGLVTANFITVPKSLRDQVDGPPKQVESGGSRGLVYSIGGLIDGDLVVVEGAMTAVAAATLGHQSMALPSASWNFPASWARSLFRDRSVALVPDGDGQGRDAMERTAESALEAGARSVGIVELHSDRDDGRDLADDLREHGREAAAEMLATAIGRTTFTEPNRSRGRPPTSLAAAEMYLRHQLADSRWHPVAEINENAPGDVSVRTLKRAREMLNVESRKFGKAWHIRLSHA